MCCPSHDTLESTRPRPRFIAYTHGLGIDASLAIYRDIKADMVVPEQDLGGKFGDGTRYPTTCAFNQIYWPEATRSRFAILGQLENGPPSWYGSVIEGQQDASRFQYKRNRYGDLTYSH